MARFTDITNLDKAERRKVFLELMTQPIGNTRRKAIETIMKRKNMSFEQAQKHQALKITGLDEKV